MPGIDSKEALLPLITAILRSDYARIVVDPTGTPISSVIAIEDLLKYGAFASKVRTVTASGNVTLANTDPTFIEIDPNGSDRDVTCPAKGNDNHGYFVRHIGTSKTLTVKRSGGTAIATLYAGEIKYIMPSTVNDFSQLNSVPSSVNASYNYLINGGFDFVQRQTPGTLTTIAQDTYSADRFRISRENADLQYQRVDGTGESGLTSKFFGTYKKITNTGKFMVYQILEGANSVHLRGKTVTFQVQMKASASKTIRMAILELQNAGTMDTIPGTFVSAWGANSTDPTLGSNLAIITAAQSRSVTTSMQTFNVTVTVPSNSKNLICALWTDSQFAANDTLSVAEAGLYVGYAVQPWNPRLLAQEFSMCQRHYWKTFLPDTGPAQNIGVDTGEFKTPAPVAGANTERIVNFNHIVPMFKAPTITTFNPAAANAQFRDATAAADCSATAAAATTRELSLQCTGNAGTVVGGSLRVHFTCEAEL